MRRVEMHVDTNASVAVVLCRDDAVMVVVYCCVAFQPSMKSAPDINCLLVWAAMLW
jgi:hypothetical protein